MASIEVAAVQFEPRLGQVGENLARICARIADTSVELVVFPECATSGYGFSSREEAWRQATEVPGPVVEELAGWCRSAGRWAVVGVLERSGDKLYNSSLLLGPTGLVGHYRKTHLLCLGVDRFTTPGDLGLPVFDTELGCIGMLICFDASIPEAPRCLKLAGAQLICLPTNWPQGAAVSRLHSPMIRAQENHVYLAACNRVGEESGFAFPGGSRICDWDGKVLVEAGQGEETIVARVDLSEADRNRVINVPGEYELDRIAQRRPEIYSIICER